ncbi:hypothetical protein Aph02nite_41400 [Actinoplanes philippinensis]|uniref:Uncharacterized protein n=1 Tax=Actinoplanes philippinensis TaxID=35752 RepID=A0A1I2GY71_9ACTN|nr:hypothetical protein [Actinoplanes philippinensis]GIE78190.1 hypothetical protein Aph02nite_41400 [Actinoplanes philippinensis]SFF22029.1 hypothetical protein SAMN05421541_107269 [Actinoplanes philippinensis]
MSRVLAATRDLLASLDPLSYRMRMTRLAEWARSAPDRARVCADLREQGPYERRLALVAAMTAGAADEIAAAVFDPQPSISGAALTMAVRAGIPAGDHADRPAVDRRRVYRTLRRHVRPGDADALIGRVRAEFGDEEAAALLPACGSGTVRALLPDLEHALSPGRLVRRHPEVLVDRIRERLAAAPAERRDRIWAEAAGAVLRCAPEQALDLLEQYAPERWLPGPLRAYGVLAAYDARRLVPLLASPGRAAWLRRIVLPHAVLRRLATLPTAELAPLAARLRENDRGLAALLRAVAPARRAELYDHAMAEVDVTAWAPADVIMEVLPAGVRIREATRMLAMPEVREREDSVYRWSACLAWPEASAALETALRSGDAAVRATGYTRLLAAARRSRDPRTVAEAMGRLGRLRNEQDPVRAAALTALSGTAPLLTADTAPGLTRLTTDAVEARDASAASMRALSGLAADVLRHHVRVPELREWALLTTDLVTSGSQAPTLRRFGAVLRRGDEAAVFDRLRGWVEAGVARGRYGPLFALTHALDGRARNVPELQELLRRAIGPETLPSVARTAIALWLDDPRTRAERVAEVLEIDASAVMIDPVWPTLCKVRTDLLDRVLDRAPRGRFVDARIRWAPAWAPHCDRWLPRQQARFLALQEQIIADTGQGVWQRAAAVRAAARVPAGGREATLRHVGAPEVPIAEAALGALVWTDRPADALPVLLGHAGGDRARVALYAAGRAAQHVPPSRLPEVLGPLLTGDTKVTSRKEAARLLARYGPPHMMGMLLDAYTHPAAHRDVRAAIVSAARQRLDAEAAWRILETALTGSREERQAVLDARASTIPARHRPRYGALIVASCRVADREVRRAAFGRLNEWAPWLDGLTGLVVDRITDLGETIGVMEFAELLAAGGDEVFGPALTRLVERDAADDRPGGPGTDRPARRRVAWLAQAAAHRSAARPAGADRSVLVDRARWLADRPGFAPIAVRLLVDLGRLDNLGEVADRCAGRPVLAVRAAEHLTQRMRDLSAFHDTGALARLAGRLAARGDLAGGLLALALAEFGHDVGWTAPWPDLVHELRRHPEAGVRDEAIDLDMAAPKHTWTS